MSRCELGLYESTKATLEITRAEDLSRFLPALGEPLDEFLGRFGFNVVGFMVNGNRDVGVEFVGWGEDLRHEEGWGEACATVGDAPGWVGDGKTWAGCGG